ncbi:MAG TPA: sugar ABC transporter substrate-binding protein [Chloroflexota bacterium]|nr:sugar ABC transporter substrate-binding protein [Chloroflexota bacterium]
MTRRQIVSGPQTAGLLLTTAGLAACQPGRSDTGAGAGPTAAAPVTVQYLGRGSAGEEEIYRELIGQFGERNPQIKVDINWAGTGGAPLIAEKVTAMLAGGTPPDTFWVHCYSTLDFAGQQVLADLTPYTRERGFDLGAYYKGPLDDFRWEGQLLALPRETSTLVMFYNKGMLAESGVKEPTAESTWNDWLEMARLLTREGPSGKIFGTFASASAFNIFQMIWQNGGEIMNERRTQSLLDSPAAIEAAQFIVDLRLRHRVAPVPADYEGQTTGQFMIAGRLASLTTGQSLALDLQKANPFPWDVVAVPMQKQKAYAQASSGHGVTRASKHPAAGWELVKWLAGEEASKLYAARGLVIPAMIKVTESDVFSGAGMPANYGKTWRDALRVARSFAVTRRWIEVQGALDKELAPALDGTKPVPDAMRAMKAAIDQILSSS